MNLKKNNFKLRNLYNIYHDKTYKKCTYFNQLKIKLIHSLNKFIFIFIVKKFPCYSD